MTTIISQSNHGKIFKCSTCKLIHFEYKNLNFNFTPKEYNSFTNYILKLEGEYWEITNAKSLFTRKILIPAGNNNFNILLNNEELMEIKQLFYKSNYTQKTPQIFNKYTFSNN